METWKYYSFKLYLNIAPRSVLSIARTRSIRHIFTISERIIEFEELNLMHTNISLLLKNKLYLFECVCIKATSAHMKSLHLLPIITRWVYINVYTPCSSFLCRKFEILFYCTHTDTTIDPTVCASLPPRPILIFIIKSFSWLLRATSAHARHVFEVNAPLALRFFGSGSQLIILCLLRTARVSYIIFYPLAEMNKCVW